MRAASQALDDETSPKRGVYDAPFPPDNYRGLYMVADDGVLLVEIRVHNRALEKDLVPGFRAWLARIEEKERGEHPPPLQLITPAGGGEKAS